MSATEGKRILVLEDEVLLALEVADTLEEVGAIVVGPAHRIETAMRLVDSEMLDAALLDVNIHGASSSTVAERLLSKGVPFILATGYGNRTDVAGGMEVIDKPYNRQQMQSAFQRVFEQR